MTESAEPQTTQSFPPIQIREGGKYYTRNGRLVRIDRVTTTEEQAEHLEEVRKYQPNARGYAWHSSEVNTPGLVTALYTDNGQWLEGFETAHDLVAEYNSPAALPLIDLRIKRLKEELKEVEEMRRSLTDLSECSQFIRTMSDHAARYPWEAGEAMNDGRNVV